MCVFGGGGREGGSPSWKSESRYTFKAVCGCMCEAVFGLVELKERVPVCQNWFCKIEKSLSGVKSNLSKTHLVDLLFDCFV